MLKISLVLSLLVLCSSALWICPSEEDHPTLKSIHSSKRSPFLKDCQHIKDIEHRISFLVKVNPLVELKSNDWITFIDLAAYPGFVVALVEESATQEMEQMLLQNEFQLITPKHPRRKESKRDPELQVTFQKTAIKDEIVNGLDGDLFYDEMEKITGEKPFTLNGQQYTVKTRYTHTQGNNDAAAYFLQRFKDMGYEASYQTFRYSSSNTQNIIATKRGTSSEIVVIGAHYDSISQDPQNLAPGCVDNGSGAEGVMQIAATYVNASLTRTVHFILFGAEEQGLLGSNYYVDNLDNTGYNIVYSLIMDMIGYSNVYHGVKIETSSSNANTVLGDLMASNIGYYAPNLTIARTTNYFGSDHVPFIDTGIPCFLAIEQDDTAYVGYHRTTDRINYLSVSQSIGILKGLSGTLYDLAA